MKAVSQTKDFLEQVPNLINSGQLAQGQLPPAAAPQAQYAAAQQPYAAPSAQQPYAPPQQPGYGAPPAYGAASQQYGAPPQPGYGALPQLGPGARVLVLGQDGQRYPGTIVQLQGDHCLCAMQNGQFWFPSGHVSPA